MKTQIRLLLMAFSINTEHLGHGYGFQCGSMDPQPKDVVFLTNLQKTIPSHTSTEKQVSAAKADVRTLRIGCSNYVITIATKIQFPVVDCMEHHLITRNLK